MSHPIKMYEVPPSPNNMKVRIALGVKGLEYERHVLEDFSDRETMVAATTQPLTPAIEYQGVKLFDSGAIMRFLDANFPDTPRLFSEDYGEMKEIENWEWYARAQLGHPIGLVFSAAQNPASAPPDMKEKATAMMHELTQRYEDALENSDYLVGNRITAADLTAVPLIAYAMLPPEAADASPIAKCFFENLSLGENRDRTKAWAQKILAFDPHPPISKPVGA